MTRTVVFIPGAWMLPACWQRFSEPFRAAGYTLHTPAWPYLDGASAAELRRSPPAGLGPLSVGAIVEHFQSLITRLPEAPLIIGHSFGGLFTQLLLDRGVGAAGIAIDPAPVAGVVPGPVSLAAAAPVLLRWRAWERPYTLTRAGFDRSFANTAPAAVRDQAYEELVVPTSGKIFVQAAAGVGTAVHPARRRAPLLITVAEHDRTVTPYVARATYRKQRHSLARTDFKLFPGLSHFLIAEPGCGAVADFALQWARDV